MNNQISFVQPPTAPTERAQVEIFDPPMCCPTGLCGPTLDQTLMDVSQMILTLKGEQITVERYQMTSHPHLFMNTPAVMRLVQERHMAALPITLVNGTVIKVGEYPTLDEIKAALKDKEPS